ncbi:hypothetical protein Dda_2308 [Drechslerella dactyloides]|uniref:Clr5 domain-containing protein n=1 Tax=Drechslerella dactyloides TaxID=74499 RepID=A0AAD6NNS9_DREDA|nr:hypothetical protein Dda_2308 [Drechslerella dactyloides]
MPSQAPGALDVEFWPGPSRGQPRRYNKVADWQPYKAYILQKRADKVPLEDIVAALRTEKQFVVELHQLKHVLRIWKSTVRISATHRRYIVSKTIQRRAAGKRRTTFKYKDSGEKIPQDKVDKVVKRYKNEAQESKDVDLPDVGLIAATPSAPSVSSQIVQQNDNQLGLLQKEAARWLQEDSTLTPIEETMMAMSLIGECSIPDLYQLVDESVPGIPAETLDRADPAAAQPAGQQDETYATDSAPSDAETPEFTDPKAVEDALQTHVEHGQAHITIPTLDFHRASELLRPICISWLDKVKRNALAAISQQSPEPQPTIEEIESLGYTPTESSEPLPLATCAEILQYLDDDDPLPYRGHDILNWNFNWEPVSKLYHDNMPALWGLFAGTTAFESVKLYLDDIARVFYLPTLVAKYGKHHYFVIRALHCFGMVLGLVCHPDLSADVLEIAVAGFDNLGMRLHQHTMDAAYQLAQALPFSRKGPHGIRLAQDFLSRCQAKHGLRHGRTIAALALLARGMLNNGQKPLARGLLSQVNRLNDSLHESDKTSKDYADALRDIGKAEFYAGLQRKAQLTLLAALQRNDDLGHRAPDSSHLSFLLGMVYSQSAQWENAIIFLRRSTMYRSDTFGEMHRASASSMEALSNVWEKRGIVLYENPMLELLEKLLRHYESRFGQRHERTYKAYVKYGAAMMAKEAAEAERVTEVEELE